MSRAGKAASKMRTALDGYSVTVNVEEEVVVVVETDGPLQSRQTRCLVVVLLFTSIFHRDALKHNRQTR